MTNPVPKYSGRVPEGDALHLAARRLQVLVGQRVAAESPHPRAAVKGIAAAVDGRRLEAVEAIGKNLLLRFEGDVVVRSHLRMKGRWQVAPRGSPRVGRPWLVLRGDAHEALLWNGSVLELDRGVAARLGPDVLAEPPDFDAMLRRLRAADPRRALGEAILDQRLVAGIGNVWKAESLWTAGISPWLPLGEAGDDELRAVLAAAHQLMGARLEGRSGARAVYRRAGRPCPRCGSAIRAWPQGDAARTAYWCPGCQRGLGPAGE
jgi:endonuclease-8